MKILVVGGAGYIGSHVAKKLLSENHEVTIFDNLSTGLKENILPGANFIEGDITSYEQILSALSSQEAVIHLAALKAVGESMTNPEKYSKNNLIGTLNLLNAMCEQGVKKIVFSSSCTVYGEPKYLPLDEKHPLSVINYYGFTKLEIERTLEWYSRLKDIRFVILRYFNAVGYDHEGILKGLEKNPQNLLPVVMETILGQREQVTVFGDNCKTPDGTCVRDYVHVDDLAEGHAQALAYLNEKNQDLIVNLGTGQGLSVKEIIDEAKSQSGVDFNVVIGPRRAGDAEAVYANNQFARDTLGFNPKYSDLKTIVSTTLRAYGIK